MKIYLLTCLSILSVSFLIAQNIPIDFEEEGFGADWNWTTFENNNNPELEIVANPDPNGYNESSFVAKFTALESGQPFAGCETLHGAGIGSFTIDETNATIRIMVWKSVISDVGIKLVRSDNWSLGEIKIANTKVNEWEQLIFDFSDHIGNPYDQIVIFPDFNDRSSDNVIYFDNIYGDVAATTSTENLSSPSIKLFPNPVSENITLTSDRTLEKYEVHSISGTLFLQGALKETETVIEVSKLPAGLYLLTTLTSGEKLIKKFLKTN